MAFGILLIEDEVTLAKNIKLYLDRHGYETVLAGTASEGLRIFEQSHLDLVLLDLNLPDLHGLEVLAKMRRLNPRVPVICVTGHGSAQIAEKAKQGGAYAFVVKPTPLCELKLHIEKALAV